MFQAFRSLLHTSLNRSCGLPVGRFPCTVSIEEVFGDPSIVHAHDVAEPAHTSLFQQREHTGASSSFQDSVVWDLVLPGDVQNASEAAHVKALSFRSCRARNVQDSLSYRRVLTTQAL